MTQKIRNDGLETVVRLGTTLLGAVGGNVAVAELATYIPANGDMESTCLTPIGIMIGAAIGYVIGSAFKSNRTRDSNPPIVGTDIMYRQRHNKRY